MTVVTQSGMELEWLLVGILYKVDGVATITFNRPEVSNGFNIPMCEEILEAIELCKWWGSEVLVINANGKVFFCRWRPSRMQKLSVWQYSILGKLQAGQWYFLCHEQLQPVIMSVDGPVAGAANQYESWLQISALRQKNLLHSNFCRVGLAPDAGGLYLLTQTVVWLRRLIWSWQEGLDCWRLWIRFAL